MVFEVVDVEGIWVGWDNGSDGHIMYTGAESSETTGVTVGVV